MSITPVARLLTALALLLYPAPAPAQTATFLPIPPATPGQNIAVFGISRDGSTLFGMTGPGGQVQTAFRWRQAGGMQLLWQGYAYDSSADGNVVVGGTGLSTGGGGVAVRWTPTGGANMFGGREARGVSADGTVVVGRTTLDSVGGQAFRWTQAGGMQFLPPVPGRGSMHATDVSAGGSVIAGWATAGGAPQAFRWTAASGSVGLPPLPGAIIDSQATTISGDGLVIGGLAAGSVPGEPFRHTAAGTTGLGSVPGMVFCIPADMTTNGSVMVGTLFSNDFHAAIWDPERGLRLLQSMLAADHGLTLPGWTLNAAYGISADGTRIAGFGTTPQGQRSGYLVTLTGAGGPCYANCDGSVQPPVLNVQDFGCFLARYAAGDAYAATGARTPRS